MSEKNGLNIRAIGLVITLFILAGGIITTFAVSQERLETAREDIAEVDSKLDECVKEIQGDISNVKDDMSDVKIDVAKLQIDVEIIKDDNKYMRGRLDYIVEELAKQNRGS